MRVILSALCVVLATTPLTAQRTSRPLAARTRRVLDSLAKDFATNGVVPGTAVAVVRGTDTLLFKAYGRANLELNVPMTTQSVFRIGSVTKQFASAALLQMVQEGKLSLSDSIGRYLPELPATWRTVTVTQLLNHTSGIPSYTELGDAWRQRWGEEMTGAQLLALTADKQLDFPAGSSWKYNNTGYVLVGLLLEARAGRAWHEELSARLFGPLALTHTRYCDAKPLIPGRVAGYSRRVDDRWENAAYLSMSQPHAAGALCSTICDMVRWNRALHGGQVLAPSTYAAMTTPIGAAVSQRYGFGIGEETLDRFRVLSHSGGINGSLTANLYVPEAGLSVTVLTNGDFANPDRVAHQLARAALGIPLDVPPKGIALTSAQLAPYTGVYELVLEAPHAFTVTIKDGALYGMIDGQTPEKLIPLGDHVFGVTFDRAVRVTFIVRDGRAVGFTLVQRGKTFEATRTP